MKLVKNEARSERLDAWSGDNDRKLTDLVLKYAREGKTQVDAFQEASELLGRTWSACQFRWNAVLSKEYYKQFKEERDNYRKKHKTAYQKRSSLRVKSRETNTSAEKQLTVLKEVLQLSEKELNVIERTIRLLHKGEVEKVNAVLDYIN